MKRLILAALLYNYAAYADTGCSTPTIAQINAKGVFEAALLRAKSAAKPKGEFETTAAYEARMKAGAEMVAPGGTLTFSWIADLSSFKFDADTGNVSFRSGALDTVCDVNLENSSYGLRPFCVQQELRTVREKPRLMGNAYGAHVMVDIVHDDYVGIALGGERPLSGPLVDYGGSLFAFHVNVAEAQSLKRNAVIIMRVRPVTPLYLEGSHYSGATVDNTIERSGENYLLVGNIECLSMADAVTGKVFQTIAGN